MNVANSQFFTRKTLNNKFKCTSKLTRRQNQHFLFFKTHIWNPDNYDSKSSYLVISIKHIQTITNASKTIIQVQKCSRNMGYVLWQSTDSSISDWTPSWLDHWRHPSFHAVNEVVDVIDVDVAPLFLEKCRQFSQICRPGIFGMNCALQLIPAVLDRIAVRRTSRTPLNILEPNFL